MKNYSTVKDLVGFLKEIENQNAPIIFQYYLAEHFGTSDDKFTEVAHQFKSCIPCLSDAFDTIAECVADEETE